MSRASATIATRRSGPASLGSTHAHFTKSVLPLVSTVTEPRRSSPSMRVAQGSVGVA